MTERFDDDPLAGSLVATGGAIPLPVPPNYVNPRRPMTDAEILREAATILNRRSKKPKSIGMRVLTNMLRDCADAWELADHVPMVIRGSAEDIAGIRHTEGLSGG